MGDYQIISDRAAVAQILHTRGAYNAFFGAGLSVDAGVPTADRICRRIAVSQLQLAGFGEKPNLEEPPVREWLVKNLSWDNAEDRYAKCIRSHLANPADRVDFFRKETRVRPTFAHHGAAILMSEGILGRTCLTTNFDKLLETAFATQGQNEIQALRTAGEVQYWRPDSERCFCLKLHGDYDTHNILNTLEETVRIEELLRNRSLRLLEHQGLLVLGLAGYEKSVYSLFEDLTTDPNLSAGALARGLLWGVYVGPKPLQPWDDETIKREITKALDSGAVGPQIKKMMARMATAKSQFAFFPVFGAGQFLMDLIELTRSRGIIGQAEPLLDHELRLRRVFSRAKLSPARVTEHIQRVMPQKTEPAKRHETVGVERAFKLNTNDKEIWLAYGDIASRSYLGDKDFASYIRAVVSPDDTLLSVGGGVANSLAEKAGMRGTLHEVSKFSPIPQGESRVTSGGDLPVHYIVHAATIEVADEGYRVTRADVHRTFGDVLRRTSALDVGVLSVPLLGAGVAGLSAEDSFAGLVEAYCDQLEKVPKIVVFVIYREAILARHIVRSMLEQMLPGDNKTWSNEPWPSD